MLRAATPVAVLAFATLVLAAVIGPAGCTTKEPQPTSYFDQTIGPILQASCVRTNTGVGCHVADGRGNAFGNLDLSSYDGLQKRRDLLLDYGPYLQPSLLLKNVSPYQMAIELWDGTKVTVTTDVRHTGGDVLDATASSYLTLRRWIENGATTNNSGVPPLDYTKTVCSHDVPKADGFDPSVQPTASDFPTFVSTAAPALVSCAAGNCHGSHVNALYLTCGTNDAEQRWNYFAASNYLGQTPESAELVRRPLATSQGGSYHEGGPIFSSVQDQSYKQLLTWAMAHGPAKPPGTLDPAFLFFARKVQPILAKKGCMMVQCHSAGMFHDYRLRGGSAGSFSFTTTQRNYDFSVAQMSFESDDVNASRLVRKNLFRPDLCGAPGGIGLTHRGGALLEDFGGQNPTGTVCDPTAYGKYCDAGADAGPYDYDNGSVDAIPAYCVIREWHRRERVERTPAPLSAIVYVSRPIPPAPDRPQDFDVFAGGASLHVVPATLSATGDVENLGADVSVKLSDCGLGTSPDVRRPSVSWDGKTIAFAARATANDPLAVYTMHADGTGCAIQPDIAANHPSGSAANSLPVHDFDPVFSPPGLDDVERIVFASTRGNLDSSAFPYSGPQRTPEDPTKPNANLYVLEPDTSSSSTMHVRQLTWQLNMERMPSFMQDGRLIYTAEKREPGFYELALRRQNLDGSDYHPLYSQRATIGFTQATGVVELAQKNFATIFSTGTAQHGAGSLGVFNRSIGVDLTSTDAKDYLVDPKAVVGGPHAPETAFFLHSLENGTPTGGVVGADGSYTTPSPLPDGKMLVSFGTGSPDSFGGDYDVYVFDPSSGSTTKKKLLGAAGTAEVDAVAVYARVPKGIFTGTPDEPNGNTSIHPGDTEADVTVLDMTVLGSLLFQNTPTGRTVEPDLVSFDIYEDLPPDVSSFGGCGGNTACDAYGKVYVRRRKRGTVPLRSDGSAHFRIPGGMPMVLHLGDTAESMKLGLPRWQREEMTFVPGEYAHQGFPSPFFDNLCGTCHDSISGRPTDAAFAPDFLTQASQVLATQGAADDFTKATPGPVIGPPFTP
ncbi:MAG: hypothetical protein ACRENE_09220 [Polyangiaceae bacterium]